VIFGFKNHSLFAMYCSMRVIALSFVSMGLSRAAGVVGAEQNIIQPNQGLPTVKLPYGTWQASSYDNANDVS
jgi:hypothetical protein